MKLGSEIEPGNKGAVPFHTALKILLLNKTYFSFLIRSALRFVCGIFVFGVTWILLRKSSEDNISPATWKQFMVSRLYKLIHLFIFVEFDILHVCRLFAQSSRDQGGQLGTLCVRNRIQCVWVPIPLNH